MVPSMAPQPSKPSTPFGEIIQRDFGSQKTCEEMLAAATKSVEGSGWGVLAYEPMGDKLVILQAEKHQNLTFWGVTPLLVCDVWEHAYYLQYQNRRADFSSSAVRMT